MMLRTLKSILMGIVVLTALQTALPVSIGRAAPSACPTSDTLGELKPGQTTDHQMTFGGLTRHFRLHLPTSYSGQSGLPLVASLHGFASNSLQQEAISAWSPISDREGFIVLYPDGTAFPQRWNAGDSGYIGRDAQQVDDVAFFAALFDLLNRTLCIDNARIFVTGLSNGGGMSNRLACQMADRIAAIGTVAGAYSPLPGGCQPVRPIPVIAFHGDADPIVNIGGSADGNLPPIKTWVADWAKRNGCAKGPDLIVTQGDATGSAYTDCAGNADVQYYQIAGGGHSWPGGFPIPFVGKTSTDISASETMWNFFVKHPLPQMP